MRNQHANFFLTCLVLYRNTLRLSLLVSYLSEAFQSEPGATSATHEFDHFMGGPISFTSPNSRILLLLFGQDRNIVLKCTPVCVTNGFYD